MTVGQRIKKKRLEKGLTQLELAERMGYSGKTSVSAAETCGDNITTTKVKKFADALGCSYHYLMGYEAESPATAVTDPSIAYLPTMPDYHFDDMDDESKEFLRLFESAPKEDRDLVMGFLKKSKPNS